MTPVLVGSGWTLALDVITAVIGVAVLVAILWRPRK
jgi:hypothetical protein